MPAWRAAAFIAARTRGRASTPAGCAGAVTVGSEMFMAGSQIQRVRLASIPRRGAFRPRAARKGVVTCKARVGSNQNLRRVSENEAGEGPASERRVGVHATLLSLLEMAYG